MKIKKGDKVVIVGEPDYIERGFYHTGATGVVVNRHGDICHVCFTDGVFRGMASDCCDMSDTTWAVDVDQLELVERKGYDGGRRGLFRIPKG